jgi:hypothetical protein
MQEKAAIFIEFWDLAYEYLTEQFDWLKGSLMKLNF